MKQLGKSSIVALGVALGTPAWGQDVPVDTSEIVVVGSRAPGRLGSETASPVDILSADELAARGLSDLSRTLQFLAPSFNFPRSATAPSAANTRAATLRGLSPDQVLVLVNGKRRHSSSVVNFNNVVGRGSVPYDLNTIPVSAIERVEILRDGAAAQYGSDAIAGVINIVLKSGAASGFADVQSGITERGDGRTLTAALNHGFALGDDGSLNVTAELRERGATNRAGIDSRYGRLTGEQGDPDSVDLNAAASLRQAIGSVELYGDATYDRRRSRSPAQFRVPTTAPAIFPAGFVPHIRLRMDDFDGTLGLRGEWRGWRWDLSDTVGLNETRFRVEDTANTTLGAASPTAFEAGGARYAQNVASLGISRPLKLLAGGNLAIGAEHRLEWFKIRQGEPGSYVGAGAQGFPGYNPPSPVDVDRNAWSVYADLELRPIEALTLGGAVRHEEYSDFGAATTGKLTAFLKPLDMLALRATASTGFRAPSLQQQFFSTVTSQSSGGVLVNIGTFAVSDPVARALGSQPLRQETSRNLSGGIVLTPGGGFTLTVDAFRIEIDDRIALSETLSGAAVTAILRAAGITNASQARFFTNAVDTTTKGYEITANWRHRLADGSLALTAGYGRFDTDVDRLNTNAVVPSAPLLGPMAIGLLTTAQPKDKWTLAGRLDLGAFGLNADLVQFGEFTTISVLTPQTYGAVTTIDLTADFTVTRQFRFGIGVLNLTDAFPDKTIERGLTQGGSLLYPEAGAIGTNGREVFARATVIF
ncbi:iron complex outermembrane recepter protein [Sphingomonas guangdongensis]|uniref:Iron complex outermembrane recepter protein n=1 Tax=Sphingomonas guangdongensis TaxID=1141890 RepID=A0A285QC86_9SPHN|nr:TonB-dependent receptor [Sphingomonas guangdongensis]SOB79446.1 iron complex outermembrane recepter protein [Sphingomonas guangdongensis]